jgi:hypothetical protein
MDIYNGPEIQEPKPNDIIWKYMDLSKFYLLLKNGLWFQRLDKFHDKNEGKLSALSGYVGGVYPGQSEEYDTNIIDSSRKFYEIHSRWYVVNCWNLNNLELSDLWSQYIEGDCGVAIQSTYGKLKKVLRENSEKTRYIGKVEYIDYTTDKIPMRPLVLPAFRRPIFNKHDEEVRAVINYKERTQAYADDPGLTGYYVPAVLNELIDRVVIAPKLPSWKCSIVKQLMSENDIIKPVSPSSVDSEPY